MPADPAVFFSSFEFGDDYFRSLFFFNEFGFYLYVFQVRLSDVNTSVFPVQKNAVKNKRTLSLKPFYGNGCP